MATETAEFDAANLVCVGDRWGYAYPTMADIPHVEHLSRIYPNMIADQYWVDERDIPADLRPWREFQRTTAYRPDGTPDPAVEAGHEEFYANSHYLVYVREMTPEEEGMPPAKHLSMRTVENDVRHDWREMQRVKNELCGTDWEAVELYPAEDRVVDSANQYHLWCFPFRLPFGFQTGLRSDTLQHKIGGGNQRPFEESNR